MFIKIITTLLVISYINCTEINNKIVVKNSYRILDVHSQLAHVSYVVNYENTGNEEINTIIWTPEKHTKGILAYISLKEKSKNFLKKHDNESYEIQLQKPLIGGDSCLISLTEIYARTMIPFPAEIHQEESQMLLYTGNLYFYTPYFLKNGDTRIQIDTKKLITFPTDKFTVSNDFLEGSYQNINPFTYEKLTLHYRSKAPQMIVTSVKRTIDISNWGMISIEEHVEVRHVGARIKKFSRADYMLRSSKESGEVNHFMTMLPASATDIYYIDTIGNISTSEVRERYDYIELYLQPRFPLFGGWRTNYIIGYKVPMYEHMKNNGEKFFFKMKLIDNIFYTMFVEHLETNIILPALTIDEKFEAPYEVTRLPDSLAYKILDYRGRKVIRVTKENLIENHIEDFKLTYVWSKWNYLYEPLLISGALLVVFLIFIVFIRLDFSLGKIEKVKKQ